MTTVAKHPGGRPPYKPNEDERLAVACLAAVPVPAETIAKVLKIGLTTLRRYFPNELKDGRDVIAAKIGASLVHMALAGNLQAMRTYLICRCGWGPKNADAAPEDLEVVHTYMPPNHRDEPEVYIEHEIPPEVMERIKKIAEPPPAQHSAPSTQRAAIPPTSSWARLARS